MRKAWDEITDLIKENAQHRNGIRLQEVSDDYILSRVFDELEELKQAPDDPTEMADVLAILFHYCQKKDWSWSFMESTILEKLSLRFQKGKE